MYNPTQMLEDIKQQRCSLSEQRYEINKQLFAAEILLAQEIRTVVHLECAKVLDSSFTVDVRPIPYIRQFELGIAISVQPNVTTEELWWLAKRLMNAIDYEAQVLEVRGADESGFSIGPVVSDFDIYFELWYL